MKKLLVLGGYGNIGQVVVKDLLESGYYVGIAGRDKNKLDNFTKTLNAEKINNEIINLDNPNQLENIFLKYDLIINCLEYTFNQIILDLCIKTGKKYVDLGDNYNGIITSKSKEDIAKKSNIVACLGAGSSPGIVNILTKYAAKDMQKIETLNISFVDQIYNGPEKMLPFNFSTVVEEVLGDALIFEDGKYKFVKGSTKTIDANFCRIGNNNNSCLLNGSYITNHDEQFSLPNFLKEKGIKNVYFVMKHNENIVNLIKYLDEFGFLDKSLIEINGINISPYEFTNKIMSKYAPKNFEVEDKESLFIKLDKKVVEIVNYSVKGVPAGVMNTGIGCSIISQYIVKNDIAPGIYHPEDFVNELWFINELKQRNFKLYIDGKEI